MVIITANRQASLARLCDSLTKANYLGATNVDIEFNAESFADEATLDYLENFLWPYGKKSIRHRVRQGGLLPAISESWYPTSLDEYAIILEDDIEVSPYFFAWAKFNTLKYRYDVESAPKQFFGISLYTPRVAEVTAPKRNFDAAKILAETGFAQPQSPYLLQLPCSWGAVYFPEHWRSFHQYLLRRQSPDVSGFLSNDSDDMAIPDLRIPNSRSNSWKASWKKYFIELTVLRGWYMLYPNYREQASFSTNHLENGEHIGKPNLAGKIKNDQYVVPLIEDDALFTSLGALPEMEKLPLFNLEHQLSTKEQALLYANELRQKLKWTFDK